MTRCKFFTEKYYDTLGQVTSAKKYWSDGTLVAGQQTTHDFDDIGNRKSAAGGGDQFGNNLRSATYGANLLNQYTNRTVPGYLNILGSATNTATATVNNQATYRRSNYFHAELSVTNASAAVWLSTTNLAVLNNGTNADIVASTIGKVYVPQTPEAFGCDADGNLTNDGRWSYTWDAENRATSFTRNSSAPSGSKIKLDCQYDYRARRTQKIVSTWNGSAYVAQSTNKFVYDGWNLTAILDATNGLVQSFTWGTDASGTIQGAGGVGGLISVTVHQGTNAGTYFYCFDGNQNVATLANATNGMVEAVYEFDAFLGILRATGRLAFVNPFVGSTKFCDWETGFLYYGFRYYDPDTGRWLSRDPLEEAGGSNLYGFVQNTPNNATDFLGLKKGQTLIVLYIDDEKTIGADFSRTGTILKNVDSCIVLDLVEKRIPSGIKRGKQTGKTYGNDVYDNVFFIDFRISPTPDIAGGSLEGYGQDFSCIIWPVRVKTDWDQLTNRPRGWESSTSTAAYSRVSGVLAAHEILHSLGADHFGSNPKFVMAGGGNRWMWLIYTPVVDGKNVERVRKTLEIR